MLPRAANTSICSQRTSSVNLVARSLRQPQRCAAISVLSATPAGLRLGSYGSAHGFARTPDVIHTAHTNNSGCSRRSSMMCQAAAAALPMSEEPAGGLTKVLANCRALLFAAWTFTLAIPLFIVMTVMALPVMAFDKFRRLAQHFVNNLWAIASTTPFYSVEIVGKENLPPASTPAVYVANHQSFMDIYSLFHLQRPFKFISKTSNFLIPIVGWSMFLTGHIMLNRVDRRSQLKCLQTCIEMLSKGASCLFFPEGTRSKDKVMGGFKKGAFSVAVKAGVPVVPITLIGTGDVMPAGREGQMYNARVKIVVHPMIQAAGKNADKVCEEARAAVASALPPELVGVDSVTDSM